MLRLTYISTARQKVTKAELGNILRVSRQNNLLVNVTGLLVSGGSRFLQALEGPDEAVEATFQRICQDERHFAAVVLSRENVEGRIFGNWAMGCQMCASSGGTGRVATDVAWLISRIQDSRVRTEFEQFSLRHAA